MQLTMKKKFRVLLVSIASVVATIALSYATCYDYVYSPQCRVLGACYGQCTPAGCSQSTCLIATQNGYEYDQTNTYPVAGGRFPYRLANGWNVCQVGSCKLYNNCTQSYEFSPISGCSCDVVIPMYIPGVPEGCP
jgi:hypothetical protein